MSIGMIWLIGSFITLVLWACAFAHDYTTKVTLRTTVLLAVLSVTF